MNDKQRRAMFAKMYSKKDFEQYKKDRLTSGYDKFHGNYQDWLEHEKYMADAFGDSKSSKILKEKLIPLRKQNPMRLRF